MSPAVVILLIFGIGFMVWLSEWSVRRRVLRRMDQRTSRTAPEFGQAFFAPSAAPIAAKVRDLLSRHITVDLSRLDPKDTFADLEMVELDSLATVGFVVDLEQEFAITIPGRDAAGMKTVGDVVEYVALAVDATVTPNRELHRKADSRG